MQGILYCTGCHRVIQLYRTSRPNITTAVGRNMFQFIWIEFYASDSVSLIVHLQRSIHDLRGWKCGRTHFLDKTTAVP